MSPFVVKTVKDYDENIKLLIPKVTKLWHIDLKKVQWISCQKSYNIQSTTSVEDLCVILQD